MRVWPTTLKDSTGPRLGLVVFALAALAGHDAAAQLPPASASEEASPEPAPPRYQIELIVFAHTDGDPSEEQFEDEAATARANARSQPVAIEAFGPSLPGSLGFEGRAPGAFDPLRPRSEDPATATGPLADPEPIPAADDPLGTDADAAALDATEPADPFEFIDPFGTLAAEGESADDSEEEFAFRFLRPDELQLRSAYSVMDRLGAYRVLAHGGWVQDGLDEANAKPMDLAYLGTTNPRGTVKLYLGRFLHVAVDLEYQTPPRSAVDTFGLAEIDIGRWYRLKTERNAIRSGELHYIDHPLFGVLVLITPAPEEEEIIEDDTGVLAPAA